MEYGKREIVFCARLFKLGEKYLDSQPNAKECENALPFEMMKDARYKFTKMYVVVWQSIIQDLTGIKFL
jgi:predicted phage-related endonuclease